MKHVRARLSGQSGNVIAYIAMLLILFGVIGAIMATLLTSSVTSTATPNHSRRALYMAEAGMRYGLSQLRNQKFKTSEINTLNNTTYTLSASETFTLNIFGPWFESDSDQSYSSGGGPLSLRVLEGKLPPDFTVPANAWIVNYDYPGDSPSITTMRDVVTGFNSTGDTTLTISVSSDFIVEKNQWVCLAVKPSHTQAGLNENDNLYVESLAKDFFPPHHGAININRIDYVYESLIDDPVDSTRVILTKLSAPMPTTLTPFPLTVDYNTLTPYTGDFVVLSPKNHIIIPTGTSETVSAGGSLEEAVSTYDQYPGKRRTRKPDIDADDLTAHLSQTMSHPGFFNVDPAADTLDIGGGIAVGGVRFGAAWYDEDKTIGGDQNFCQAGKCKFGLGIRTFFTLDYVTQGDGFTFALINGENNDVTSVGGDFELSELLAYAGDSRLNADGTSFLDNNMGEGLEVPKLALEVDVRENNEFSRVCLDAVSVNQNTRNDPPESLLVNTDLGETAVNRDVLQFVYWGSNALDVPCRPNGTPVSYDDNRHDALVAGAGNWEFSTGGNVKSSPAISPDSSTVYFGADDKKLYALNLADREADLPFPTANEWTFTTGGNVKSSPAVSPDGTIYVGSDDGNLYAINPNGTQKWAFPCGGPVKSSPVVGSDGTIYVGSDGKKLFAINPDGTPKWEEPLGNQNVKSSPTISSDGTTIYVGTDDNKLYAVNLADREAALPFPTANEWAFTTGGDVRSSPAVDRSGTIHDGTIVVGSNDHKVYAINPDGTQKWAFDTQEAVESSPVIADNSIIYVGSNKNKLFAIDPDGTKRWEFDVGGNVKTRPALSSDQLTVYVGSDKNRVYAIDVNGVKVWEFTADGNVQSSPAVDPAVGTVYVGSDGSKFYAIQSFAFPRNERATLISYDSTEMGAVLDEDNWLNDGEWAVRMEVMRSVTQNADSNYEYTLRTWIRHCGESDCTDITGTSFEDTRIQYDWFPAPNSYIQQTIELTGPEHNQLTTFLFGFTGATGIGQNQSVLIKNFQLSFIRPNDPIVTDDSVDYPPP